MPLSVTGAATIWPEQNARKGQGERIQEKDRRCYMSEMSLSGRKGDGEQER